MHPDETPAAGSRPPAPVPARPAVFLDRDGTLIEERGPLLDPADLVLLPGVARALRRLAEAGFVRVLVTNQSAIGRGLLDRPGLDRIHASLGAALAAQGASLDAIYFCPDLPPAVGVPTGALERRKPGAGMLLEAARDHGLALSRSFMVGDQIRDIRAGRRAGCRASLLVRTGQGERFVAQTVDYDACCADLDAAVDWILMARSGERGDPIAGDDDQVADVRRPR